MIRMVWGLGMEEAVEGYFRSYQTHWWGGLNFKVHSQYQSDFHYFFLSIVALQCWFLLYSKVNQLCVCVCVCVCVLGFGRSTELRARISCFWPWICLFSVIVMKVKVKSLSCVPLFVIPWTVTYQAPPSMGFSKQEYWSGVPFPSAVDLPDPGTEPVSPAL